MPPSHCLRSENTCLLSSATGKGSILRQNAFDIISCFRMHFNTLCSAILCLVSALSMSDPFASPPPTMTHQVMPSPPFKNPWGKTGQWEMVSDKSRSPQLVMRYHDDQQEQFLSIRILFVPNYRKVDGLFGCWIRDRNAKAFHTTVSPLQFGNSNGGHRWASYDSCIYVASELHVDIVAPWNL